MQVALHVYPSNLQTQKKKYILKENDSKDSHPLLSYGWAKLIAEKQIINLSNKIKNSKFVILRFVGIYGSNQNTNIEKGSIIPVLCKRASNYPKSEYKILTNGEEVRSYCHIDDTCNCIFKLILKINKINKYETFNVCSSQKIKIKDIAKKIILISKKKFILKIPKKKASGVTFQVCSNKKIKKFLTWKIQKTFDQGLREIYKYISSK